MGSLKYQKLVAMALLAVVLFSGCKRTQFAQTMGPVLDDYRYDPTQNQPARQIEIVTYSNADFSDTLGFDVVSLPNGEDLAPYKFFVIDGWYGQIEFDTTDSWQLVLRVARADEMYLSGTYLEKHNASDETRTIDGMEVRLRTSSEGCAMISWQRGDFQYLLHSSRHRGMPQDALIENVVANTNTLETVPPADASASG